MITPFFAAEHGCASVADSAAVELVPIRVDLEQDGCRVKETFTWNMNDLTITPRAFALQLCHDENLPRQFTDSIALTIDEQLREYRSLSHMEIGHRMAKIVLRIQIGATLLEDCFLWDHGESLLTPENFAEILCSEIGLGGEFETRIAHSIREQLLGDRKVAFAELAHEHESVIKIRELTDCFRGVEAEDWSPQLHMQSWLDVDRADKESDLEARRRKRMREEEEAPTAGRRSGRARKEVSYAVDIKKPEVSRNRVTGPFLVDYHDPTTFPRVQTPARSAVSEQVNEYFAEPDGPAETGSFALSAKEQCLLDALRDNHTSVLQGPAPLEATPRSHPYASEQLPAQPRFDAIDYVSVQSESAMMMRPGGSVKVYKDNAYNRRLGRAGQVKVMTRGSYNMGAK